MLKTPTPILDIINQYPYLTEIVHEDKLDLELFPKIKPDGLVEIADCDSYLQINDARINKDLDVIPNYAFKMLFDKANDMRSFGANYITALKIYFGIDSDNNFRILYQPLYLASANVQNDYDQQYDVYEGSYYSFDGSSFSLATNTEKNMIALYKSNIKIKHMGDNYFSNYIAGVDTSAVIFSFQEIFTLNLQNHDLGLDKTVVHSCVKRTALNAGIDVKHSLLLSAESTSHDKKFDSDFKGKYANRANLCPPDCDNITYTLSFRRNEA